MTSPLPQRRHRQVAWPPAWSRRIEGFSEEVVFRLDWVANAGMAVGDRPLPARLAVPDVVLQRSALVAPDFSGALMSFSPWAVNDAWRMWRLFDIRRLTSSLWFVNWLNEAQTQGVVGGRAQVGIPGAQVMAVGDRLVVFSPRVLGPLGRLVETGPGPRVGSDLVLELVESLAWRVAEGYLQVRGPQVMDGYWRHGYVEPWSPVGGWCPLPIRAQINENREGEGAK